MSDARDKWIGQLQWTRDNAAGATLDPEEIAELLAVLEERRADLPITTAQIMADERVRALVDALTYYAPSEIAGVLYYGGDDSGRRAVKAIAQFKEVTKDV